MKKVASIFILVSFCVTSIMGPNPVYAQDFRLPAPGVMVHLSPEFNPPILKGIKVHPNNPFRFDFILDQGDGVVGSPSSVIASLAKQSQKEQLKIDSTKLIKYFLASLTIPEKDLWVNLSPYEKDRIIPESFGQTEMGRDLLAEDYMLKQITASLIYPEDAIGRKFWTRIYTEAAKKFGTTNIPVNTFNKVWIVPDKAVVYENVNAGTAYVVESKLKVMLEQDYLSLQKHADVSPSLVKEGVRGSSNNVNAIGSQITREIVIPALTKEINENKNFTQLRQVYNSLILATWYKKKIKDSILNKIYSDKNKIMGVSYKNNSLPLAGRVREGGNSDVEFIYQQYLQAFKKGAFNYIKEDKMPYSFDSSAGGQPIIRKYFSGGFDLAMKTHIGSGDILQTVDHLSINPDPSDHAMIISTIFNVVKKIGGLRGNDKREVENKRAFLIEVMNDFNKAIEKGEDLNKLYHEIKQRLSKNGQALLFEPEQLDEGVFLKYSYIDAPNKKIWKRQQFRMFFSALGIYITENLNKNYKLGVLNEGAIQKLNELLSFYNMKVDSGKELRDSGLVRLDIPSFICLSLDFFVASNQYDYYRELNKKLLFIPDEHLRDETIALSLFMMARHFPRGQSYLFDDEKMDYDSVIDHLPYAIARLNSNIDDKYKKCFKLAIAKLITAPEIHSNPYEGYLRKKRNKLIKILMTANLDEILQEVEKLKTQKDGVKYPLIGFYEIFYFFDHFYHQQATYAQLMFNFDGLLTQGLIESNKDMQGSFVTEDMIEIWKKDAGIFLNDLKRQKSATDFQYQSSQINRRDVAQKSFVKDQAILSLSDMRKIVGRYFRIQKRGGIDFRNGYLEWLGEGDLTKVIGYADAVYRLLNYHQGGEYITWYQEEENFNYLGQLNISPRFLTKGRIKLREQDRLVTEIEKVFGKPLDPNGSELTPEEKLDVTKLLDDLIEHDIDFDEFKPSHIMIGSIRRKGNLGPKKAYIVDVSGMRKGHFKTKRELIQKYIKDMIYSGDDDIFHWHNLDPKREIVRHLEKNLAMISREALAVHMIQAMEGKELQARDKQGHLLATYTLMGKFERNSENDMVFDRFYLKRLSDNSHSKSYVVQFDVENGAIAAPNVDLRSVSFSIDGFAEDLTGQSLGTQIGNIFSKAIPYGVQLTGVVTNEYARRKLFQNYYPETGTGLIMRLTDRRNVVDNRPKDQVKANQITIAEVLQEVLPYTYVGDSQLIYNEKGHMMTGVKALHALLTSFEARKNKMVPIFSHIAVKIGSQAMIVRQASTIDENPIEPFTDTIVLVHPLSNGRGDTVYQKLFTGVDHRLVLTDVLWPLPEFLKKQGFDRPQKSLEGTLIAPDDFSDKVAFIGGNCSYCLSNAILSSAQKVLVKKKSFTAFVFSEGAWTDDWDTRSLEDELIEKQNEYGPPDVDEIHWKLLLKKWFERLINQAAYKKFFPDETTTISLEFQGQEKNLILFQAPQQERKLIIRIVRPSDYATTPFNRAMVTKSEGLNRIVNGYAAFMGKWQKDASKAGDMKRRVFINIMLRQALPVLGAFKSKTGIEKISAAFLNSPMNILLIYQQQAKETAFLRRTFIEEAVDIKKYLEIYKHSSVNDEKDFINQLLVGIENEDNDGEMLETFNSFMEEYAKVFQSFENYKKSTGIYLIKKTNAAAHLQSLKDAENPLIRNNLIVSGKQEQDSTGQETQGYEIDTAFLFSNASSYGIKIEPLYNRALKETQQETLRLKKQFNVDVPETQLNSARLDREFDKQFRQYKAREVAVVRKHFMPLLAEALLDKELTPSEIQAEVDRVSKRLFHEIKNEAMTAQSLSKIFDDPQFFTRKKNNDEVYVYQDHQGLRHVLKVTLPYRYRSSVERVINPEYRYFTDTIYDNKGEIVGYVRHFDSALDIYVFARGVSHDHVFSYRAGQSNATMDIGEMKDVGINDWLHIARRDAQDIHVIGIEKMNGYIINPAFIHHIKDNTIDIRQIRMKNADDVYRWMIDKDSINNPLLKGFLRQILEHSLLQNMSEDAHGMATVTRQAYVNDFNGMHGRPAGKIIRIAQRWKKGVHIDKPLFDKEFSLRNVRLTLLILIVDGAIFQGNLSDDLVNKPMPAARSLTKPEYHFFMAQEARSRVIRELSQWGSDDKIHDLVSNLKKNSYLFLGQDRQISFLEALLIEIARYYYVSNVLKIQINSAMTSKRFSLDRVKFRDPVINVKELNPVQTPGGIDLTPRDPKTFGDDKSGEGNIDIKFHLDPAMLAQLQSAPGFVPVIVNVQPMANLREFLGIQENENTKQASMI